MKNIDSICHTKGLSVYVDDIPVTRDTLFGAVFSSPIAHGTIKKLEIEKAASLPGVVRVLTATDIPGVNQIGGIVKDEPLLAEDTVHFAGMPVAFVIATSDAVARHATQLIEIDIEPLPVITNPRIAKEKNQLIVPPRTFKTGNTEEAFKQCHYIVQGTANTNGQEHLYIETQGAYAFPVEHNGIKIYSSTQGPTAVQRHTADVLGIPMHRIEVDVTRLGGGFGGKEDQATAWAALCALGAFIVKKPVKYVLHRMEDMRMTGKRNPYTADYTIGLSKDLKILAYDVTFYQNAGAAADLSPAVLERTLFHCTNSYYIPNVLATAYSCKTNLPPNTAFRGFGGPQGMFVIEAAIAQAAAVAGVSPAVIQEKNLIETGETFPYGQQAESEARHCWTLADDTFHFKQTQEAIDVFNQNNQSFKKGMSLMPICFGISFTKTPMNQARALVHIYSDGSVNISTGAVEMGQGIQTKMLQVAAKVLSVQHDRIKVNSTNTFRIANTSPSAASATADLNGAAVNMACTALLERLLLTAAGMLGEGVSAEELTLNDEWVYHQQNKTHIHWQQLVAEAFIKRVNLSEHAHYATPVIHFNPATEKGHPFAYHVYGVALTEVTVDCIRGTYTIDKVQIVHDFGKSMNTDIDYGQIEGGLVQGIGWMTMEEIVFDDKGVLKSNALSTYKVPDIYSVPDTIEIVPLPTQKENMAILQSKAVGEPPLMYGIGTYFAIRNAVRAFNPQAAVEFDAPITPEKVLMALYPHFTHEAIS
ncbi:MAG TPA: molybdopterin-dependent oxidoreductase [Ferruginibacter sp.]|nr:molybdopterin-dependent oxidoreductase [Ferruginibacter sp.]